MMSSNSSISPDFEEPDVVHPDGVYVVSSQSTEEHYCGTLFCLFIDSTVEPATGFGTEKFVFFRLEDGFGISGETDDFVGEIASSFMSPVGGSDFSTKDNDKAEHGQGARGCNTSGNEMFGEISQFGPLVIREAMDVSVLFASEAADDVQIFSHS